jgi:group I intron endonuclease
MDKITGIYRILCVANGRYYYGSTIDIWRRWNTHKRLLKRNIHHNIIMQSSWNKHGENAFRCEIIELTSKEKLIEIESNYLKKYVGKRNCMNISREADCPTRGTILKESHRKKISMSKKGKSFSDSHRAALRRSRLGKKLSEKTKQKLSLALTGKKRTKKIKQNLSDERRKQLKEAFSGKNNPFYGKSRFGKNNPFYGKHHSDESREKISKVKKSISDETRQRMSDAHKGKKLTDSHRQHIKEGLLKRNTHTI